MSADSQADFSRETYPYRIWNLLHNEPTDWHRPGRQWRWRLRRHDGGFIHGELMPQLSPEESAKTITDLERMRDFELEKNQIIRIELKKPGLLGTGHIVITPKEGKPEKINLRHGIAYDRLMTLTQAFSPELVKSS